MGLFDFKKKKKNKKSNTSKVKVFAISDEELSKSWKTVQKAPLIIWTPIDVAFWIKYECGYKFYIEKFVQNEIGGKVLATISDHSLKDLGITSIGHRNDILHKVRERLLADTENDWDPSNANTETSSSSSSHGSKRNSISSLHTPGKNSHITPSQEIKVKLVYEGVINVIKVPIDSSFDVLYQTVTEQYGRPMSMMYTDSDSDLIQITKTGDLRDAINEGEGKNLKIHIYDKLALSDNASSHSHSSSQMSFSETASVRSGLSAFSSANTVHNSFIRMQGKVLNSLNDPAIVIDSIGTILIFNESARKFFGYTAADCIGNNIKMLMPPEIAKDHDAHLKRYITTREPHVIGSGRRVPALKKDGTRTEVMLSVSESSENGLQSFTGIFSGYDNDNTTGDSLVSDFGVLETFPQPAIVINEKGKIQFFNIAASKITGYEAPEVLGHNVKMLMPEPYKSKHNKILRRYNADPTNKRVMGGSRSVPLRRKDGNLVAVQLNLNETKRVGDRAIYTAILNVEDSESDDSDAEDEVTLEQQVQLVNFLNLPSCIIDSKGFVQAWNKRSAKTFGFKDTEMLGKNITKLMADETHKENHHTYLESYLTTGVKKVIGTDRTVEAKAKDGTIIKLMLNVKDIKLSDESHVFLGIFVLTS